MQAQGSEDGRGEPSEGGGQLLAVPRQGGWREAPPPPGHFAAPELDL